jgi:hypothetical protein
MRLMCQDFSNRWIDDGRILAQAANRGSDHQFLLLGMVSSMTTSSSGGSFHSLGRGGFGGPSGINASGFGRGFPRLRARHRSFEQNQFPPFRCPGSKYIAAPHRLHCFPRLMVMTSPASHKPQMVNLRLDLISWL